MNPYYCRTLGSTATTIAPSAMTLTATWWVIPTLCQYKRPPSVVGMQQAHCACWLWARGDDYIECVTPRIRSHWTFVWIIDRRGIIPYTTIAYNVLMVNTFTADIFFRPNLWWYYFKWSKYLSECWHELKCLFWIIINYAHIIISL